MLKEKMTVKEAREMNERVLGMNEKGAVIYGIDGLNDDLLVVVSERYSENGNGWWAGNRLIHDVVEIC